MKHANKFLLGIIGILSFTFTAMAQNPSEAKVGKITGLVIDRETNEPVEFATVSVYTTDSVLVSGNITSEDGSFSIKVEKGAYDLVVQFISYQKKVIKNVEVNSNLGSTDVGEITLSPATKTIDEATVTGEKSEMVIGLDRKIFNVGKDLSNAGKSASEILDNIPSVTVDLDGNVSLRGSQAVQILIDGKPSGLVSAGNTDALRSLQGSLIERVEVVTNPSARYEAEGMSGIINIVLKKEDREGVNGSFEVSAGYPQDYEAAVNVNFRKEKLNYFMNYGVDYGERPGEGSANQMFMGVDTTYTFLDRDRLSTGWSHNFRGGADYFINDRSTLTASVFLGYSDEDNTTTIWYRDFDSNRNLEQITLREDEEKETERNIEFSLNYDLEFDKEDQKFNAFVQYIEESETEDSDVEEIITQIYGEAIDDDPILQRVLNKESEKEILAQADYTHPWGEDGRIEAGYRSDLRLITNPYEVEERNEDGEWEYLDNFTNDFDYVENIHAVYTQAGNKFNRWSMQLGLRMELSDVRTHLKSTDDRNNRFYIDFFPTAHTSYEVNDVHSLQVSYSRRINRPHFWFLNPFNNYTDARNIRTGNPNLEPEYTNSYELGYLMKNGRTSFYSGGYWRDTRGVIERISEMEEGITYLKPYNLAEQHSFGLEANASVDPTEWWTISGDINVFRSITDGNYEGQDLYSDTYSWNARGNSMMRFDNDLDIQATFYYRGPQETTQGERKAFYMANLGVSKDVLDGNGTLTLNVRDVLNTRKFRYIIDQPDYYSENEFRWSTRSVSLSFVYRLNQRENADRQQGGDFNGDGDQMGI